jgi:hypothetical protein
MAYRSVENEKFVAGADWPEDCDISRAGALGNNAAVWYAVVVQERSGSKPQLSACLPSGIHHAEVVDTRRLYIRKNANRL